MCIRRDHFYRCPGIPCPHRAKSYLPSHSWLPTAPTGGRVSSDCTVRNPIPPLRSRHRISGRCYIAVLYRDVGSIGVAEEIVHVAQNLLIGTNEEYTEIIWFVLLQWMKRKNVADMSVGNEVGNLSIAVAGDVLQGSVAGRTLVQTLDSMIGKSWSIAQLSGRLWNREKLQKYLSARILSNPLSSSGTCFMCLARLLISWHTLQYIASISARVFRSTMP